MNIYYSDQELPQNNLTTPSIFLFGPTPRTYYVQSWRPDALSILEDLKFYGNVYVPERKDWNSLKNYEDQIEWEIEAARRTHYKVFWIPRDMGTMPALTTNIEAGLYIHDTNMYYGRPDTAPHCGYLDYIYKKFKYNEPYNDLRDLLEDVVKLCKLFFKEN